MFSDVENGAIVLSDNDKARMINLALFLENCDYDERILKILFYLFNEVERRAIYAFWAALTPATYKAYLCMKEFEEYLYENTTR